VELGNFPVEMELVCRAISLRIPIPLHLYFQNEEVRAGLEMDSAGSISQIPFPTLFHSTLATQEKWNSFEVQIRNRTISTKRRTALMDIRE
jgi:hypothetical protein